MSGGRVRAATVDDVAAMQAVGGAAGERFRELDDPRIARCADDPPLAAGVLAAYVGGGRARVAVDETDRVVGFVVFEVLDGCAHVEEVSVRPEASGQGHGSALLDAVGAWAAAERLAGVTLTTFRDVPWNRPFYERRGFRVLDDDELTPGLRARRAEEAASGLVPELRVAMRWER